MDNSPKATKSSSGEVNIVEFERKRKKEREGFKNIHG